MKKKKKTIPADRKIKFQQYINGRKVIVEAASPKEARKKFNLLKKKK